MRMNYFERLIAIHEAKKMPQQMEKRILLLTRMNNTKCDNVKIMQTFTELIYLRYSFIKKINAIPQANQTKFSFMGNSKCSYMYIIRYLDETLPQLIAISK